MFCKLLVQADVVHGAHWVDIVVDKFAVVATFTQFFNICLDLLFEGCAHHVRYRVRGGRSVQSLFEEVACVPGLVCRLETLGFPVQEQVVVIPVPCCIQVMQGCIHVVYASMVTLNPVNNESYDLTKVILLSTK